MSVPLFLLEYPGLVRFELSYCPAFGFVLWFLYFDYGPFRPFIPFGVGLVLILVLVLFFYWPVYVHLW